MSATVTFPEAQAAAPRRHEHERHRDLRWLTAAAGAATVAAVVGVSARGATRFPSFTDDEGTYSAQAWAILAHHSLSNYTYWYDHPPLGWVELAASTWVLAPLLHLLAPAAGAVGRDRLVMVGLGAVTTALVFVWCRRLGIRLPIAVGATLAFGLSPLAVGFTRQVYLDNLAAPWLVGAFVLAVSPGRRLWAFAGAGICFAVAVLCKETSLLLLPALAWSVRERSDRRTRAFCLTAFASPVVLLLLGYPLLAALKGELLPGRGHVSLWSGIAFQLWNRAPSGSVFSHSSGTHADVVQWFHADPWLLSAGLLAVPAALAIGRLRAPAIGLVTLIVAVLRPGYVPQMFVIAALPLCAVLAGGTVDELAARIRARGRRPAEVAIAVVVLIAVVVPAARGWRRGDRTAVRTDATAPQLAAEHWVEAHISRRSRILVDDSYYVDLVRAGFRPRLGVVWFFKLDFTNNLDPSVQRALPRGFAELNYVIASPVIRDALAHNPTGLQQVRRAMAASTRVAVFGAGPEMIEVRQVHA